MIRQVGDPSLCSKHNEKCEGVCPGCFGELDAKRIIAVELIKEVLRFGMTESWVDRAYKLTKDSKE